MGYANLQECIIDLERNGHLVRVTEEVDPNLEMAAIHLRVFENKGPALLFENIRGCGFRAVSNLFGTLDRSQFMFRDTLDQVKTLVDIKGDPMKALKNPFSYAGTALAAYKALPRKSSSSPVTEFQTSIDKLPLIKHWPMDGGPFVTLPIVYSEDPDAPGVMHSNIGMYRIQLGGNDYRMNEEIGLHYQLHRGIGVHQTKAAQKGQPLKVSIFVGGPPSHTLGAVMPLPEGMSELTFAGVIGARRFRYHYDADGFCISNDADFVITGEVYPGEVKPEGPFGDHLGYYSLTHDFPLMRVKKVYHRKDAIWPFTVVGRPPQEDTQFGALIHDLTGKAIPQEIPGLKSVHAVDAAGVHPLLLAVGSERYTPYLKETRPKELLTIANHVLGTGQLSLAKYLFIAAGINEPDPDIHQPGEFFRFVLERLDLSRDVHFYTSTTMDTLDYSGGAINSGSKVVFAAAGEKKRILGTSVPSDLRLPEGYASPAFVMPGVMAVSGPPCTSSQSTQQDLEKLKSALHQCEAIRDNQFPLVVLCDDAAFCAHTLNNFLWVTFTRSNPSHDIHGLKERIEFKHWMCEHTLIIDARAKPHHAPALVKDAAVEERVNRLGQKGGSLHGII